MMSALANWYPGQRVVDICVIVAAVVTLVTAVAWIVSLFLERHPPVRHWLLLSALVASLASPLLATGFIASGTSFIALPLLSASEPAIPVPCPSCAAADQQSDGPPPSAASVKAPDPAIASPIKDNLDATQVAPEAHDSRVTKTDPFQSTIAAVLLLWLCGIVVSIAGLARSGLFLRRLRRSMQPVTSAELGRAFGGAMWLLAARGSPKVMVSPLALTPMAAGWFRPVIVLPRELLSAISHEQLCDVLMHEIAHIERRDNLIALLQAVAKTAFWPIPFVHLLNRQLERAREEVCDNHVLACRDAVSYAETLLRVAQLACGAAMPVGTVGILHWRGKLEDRIFGLIHKGRSTMTRMHPLTATSVLVLFLSASVFLCGTTIVAVRAADPKQPPEGGAKKLLQNLKDQDDEVRLEAIKQLGDVWSHLSGTLRVTNVLLRETDTKRNSISVTIGAEALENVRGEVWTLAGEVKEGGLYLGVNGKIVRLPIQSAQLDRLRLAKDAKIVVDGKAATIGDLKPMSLITIFLTSDEKEIHVREVRATTKEPPKDVPAKFGKAIDGAMREQFGDGLAGWTRLPYSQENRTVGWEVEAKTDGLGALFRFEGPFWAKVRYRDGAGKELAVTDDLLTKLRFDPGLNFVAGDRVKVFLALPADLNLDAIKSVVIE